MKTIPNLSPSLSLVLEHPRFIFFNPFGFSIGIFLFYLVSQFLEFFFFFLWFLNATQVIEEMLKLNFGLDVWNPIAYARAMLFTYFF